MVSMYSSRRSVVQAGAVREIEPVRGRDKSILLKKLAHEGRGAVYQKYGHGVYAGATERGHAIVVVQRRVNAVCHIVSRGMIWNHV